VFVRGVRGGVGVGVEIVILKVQKIWDTMSDFFNEYRGWKNANIVLVNTKNRIMNKFRMVFMYMQ
jgi:hypothetical protein